MMRAAALSTLVFSIMGFAQAEDAAFLDGTFAAGDGCAALRANDGLLTEETGTVLTSAGFVAIEWQCDFVRIDRYEATDAWVASLMCEEPGYLYPDMVALRLEDESTIVASFLSDAISLRNGGSATHGQPFLRCEAAE